MRLLGDNDYPIKLISRLLHRYFTIDDNVATTVGIETAHDVAPLVDEHGDESTLKRYFSLPYVPHVSERIVRCIKSTMTNVEISMKSFKNVGRYFTKLKDPTPTMMQSNVVYAIPCADCDDRCYIGTTTQLLKSRMNQHKNDVKNKKPDKSALHTMRWRMNIHSNLKMSKLSLGTIVIINACFWKSCVLNHQINV